MHLQCRACILAKAVHLKPATRVTLLVDNMAQAMLPSAGHMIHC